MKDIKPAYRAALIILWVSVVSSTTVKAQAPVIFADEEACPVDLIDVPLDLIPYLNRDPAQLPINLEADFIDIPSADKLELRGGAFATQGARAIYADEILFDKKTMSLEAQKVILFSEQGDRITAVALDLDMETRIGSASDVTLQLSRRDPIPKRKIEDFSTLSFDKSGYTMAVAGTSGSVKGPSATGYSSGTIRLSSGEILAINSDESEITDQADIEPISVKAKARATASRLFLEGHDRERLQDVVYSRCVAGDDAVLIEASEITLDHASGIGVGENLKVRFYGVPIAYVPRLSFPITEERKSGLLFPTIGYGNNWGFNVEVPYYWNIAPSRDATFSGRYMGNRGFLGSGEFRYMGDTTFSNFNGIVRGEFMPDDSKYSDGRYGFSYQHRQNIEKQGSRISLNADVGYVSDKDYLTDLANNLEISSASHLPQRADVSIDPSDIFLEDENFLFNVDASAYQTVDKNVSKDDEPYSRLPGIRADWEKGFTVGSQESVSYNVTRFTLKPEVKSELVNFGHASSSKTTGLRWDTETSLAVPIERSFIEITPKVTYAYTAYNVENQSIGQSSDPTRGIYLLELGSKLFLEREVSWRETGHIQTLVPSLTYHYVPYEDQDDLPVFDSGSVGFDNIADAFLGNGFWGSDRIQNFQGFTLGLASETYQSDSGDDLLRWDLAQQIYLADREVTIGSEELDDSDLSPLVGEIDFYPTQTLKTDGFLNWNWDESKVEHWRLGAALNPDFRRKLAATYGWYETSSSMQLDFTWPISSRWQFGSTLLRSESDSGDDGIYSKVSLGYDACCWAIQVALEDRPNGSDDESETKFMATFSLKGMGRISTDQLEGGFTASAPSLN